MIIPGVLASGGAERTVSGWLLSSCSALTITVSTGIDTPSVIFGAAATAIRRVPDIEAMADAIIDGGGAYAMRRDFEITSRAADIWHSSALRLTSEPRQIGDAKVVHSSVLTMTRATRRVGEAHFKGCSILTITREAA